MHYFKSFLEFFHILGKLDEAEGEFKWIGR